MTRATFDVLKEPWIPVIRLDGSSDELGILDCLEQAHEIREIKDPSPIVEFGLYRLLVAFVLDALVLADQRPEIPRDLKALLDDGAFDAGLLGEYVATCGDAFDLFHPERPFLQRVDAEGEPKSVFDFYPIFPTGNNWTFFAHQTSAEQVVTVREGARLLTTIAPFNVKVKTGQPRTLVGDPPVFALPVGETLHSTIVLNLPLPDSRHSLQEEKSAGPIWRTTPVDGQAGTTPGQSFTWPCRLVRLGAVSVDGLIASVINEKGLRSLPGWKDPSCAVLESGDGKVRHLRFEQSRPLWRDAGILSFLDHGSTRRWGADWAFSRPQVVSNSLTVQSSGSVQMRFYGLRTDQAKVLEWTRSTWTVPCNLGRSTRLGLLAQRELERSENAAQVLAACIKSLAPGRKSSRRGSQASRTGVLRTVQERCLRAYWQQLEAQFAPLMMAFASLDANAPDDPALVAETAKGWREAIRHLALQQFEFASKDMDVDADALERLVGARARLAGYLRKELS